MLLLLVADSAGSPQPSPPLPSLPRAPCACAQRQVLLYTIPPASRQRLLLYMLADMADKRVASARGAEPLQGPLKGLAEHYVGDGRAPYVQVRRTPCARGGGGQGAGVAAAAKGGVWLRGRDGRCGICLRPYGYVCLPTYLARLVPLCLLRVAGMGWPAACRVWLACPALPWPYQLCAA